MARKGTLKRTDRHCLYCLSQGKSKEESEIILENYRMVPIENPYLNLWFHEACYKEIKDLAKFINNTTDLWLNKR